MNKVIFVCRQASNITIRRYFMLAIKFKQYNVEAHFLAIDNCSKEYIQSCYEDLEKYYNISDKTSYEYNTIPHATSSKKEFSPIDNSIHSPDMKLFLDSNLKTTITQIETFYNNVELYIKQINPSFIFYDLPLLWTTLTFIEACKNNNTTTISLEHAEGMGKVYSNLLPVADYYIAYGSYNINNLLHMGVSQDKIWKTGNIDSYFMNLITKSNYEKPKNTILLVLKPLHFKNENSQLIKKVFELFPKFHIIIKPHPVIYKYEESMNELYGILKGYENFSVVETYEPLSISLNKAEFCICFNSFVVIEASLMKTKLICLTGLQDEVYPNWAAYNIHCININNLNQLTSEYLNNIDFSSIKYNQLECDFRLNEKTIPLTIVNKSISLLTI